MTTRRGDGNVGVDDDDQFVKSFTNPDGSMRPGGGVVDFDADEDVGCTDWSALAVVWTQSGAAPRTLQRPATSPRPSMPQGSSIRHGGAMVAVLAPRCHSRSRSFLLYTGARGRDLDATPCCRLFDSRNQISPKFHADWGPGLRYE